MQYWTVNDEADLAYLASVGADALITDYPDRAAAVLQGWGKRIHRKETPSGGWRSFIVSGERYL